MNDKFKYAPGRPGIGTKGDKGDDGKQGLGMYFTDYDPVNDSILINSRIAFNLSLQSSAADPLPDGRTYQTGDLFFDSEGKAYEIDAENDKFSQIFASLNMGGFFLPLGYSSSTGFQRYFNSNTSPRYIIDNVYTDSGAINYAAVPDSIYGVAPINFARIEYTNVKPNAGIYNPFTLYSAAQSSGIDDHKSLALVYREDTSTFHIGNTDNLGNIRKTNLTFDVSLLKHTKHSGNVFTPNTPDGAILTNYEIAANSLFDPNFNPSPTSFIGILGTNDCSIAWNLSHFTNDSNVEGDLYFCETQNSYSTSIINVDSSMFRPLVFSNVPTVGSVRITGIPTTGKIYTYYMKLSKNGWSRRSDANYLFQGTLLVSPTSHVLNSSDATTVGFDVDANYTWNASTFQNPEGMITSVTSSYVGTDGSISVGISANSSTNARMGKIRVQLQPNGIYKDVSIWQPRGAIGPELFLNPITPSNAFSYSAWPYYSANASWNGKIKGYTSIVVEVSSNRSWYVDTISPGITVVPDSSGIGKTNVTITTATNQTLVSKVKTITFDCGTSTTLNVYQEPVYAWIEISGNRYDFPITASYDSGSNVWNVNSYAQPSGSYLGLNMRFSDSASIPWAWKDPNPYLSWLSTTDKTGVGNSYGPTLEAMSTPSGSATMDGSAGEIEFGDYPLYIYVSGY